MPRTALQHDGGCTQKQVWERLKAYENTGLSPAGLEHAAEIENGLNESGYSMNRWAELMKADKDGRVVVLPCKTVFELAWDAGPDCDLVCPVSIDGNGCCDFCDKGKLFAYERLCRQEHIERLGKTVFITREEAEKALEAMKDGNG